MCKVMRWSWKPGPQLSARSPAARPSPASLPGCCNQEAQHAHSAQTWKARLAARGHPTLMTAAQVAVAAVASGSGSALLASRRVPAPRATASSPGSLARAAPVGGAGAPHKPRPRAPRGHPSFPTHPDRAPGPWGLVSGRAYAPRTGAHTGPHAPQ